MGNNHCYKFNVKYLVGKCPVSSGLSPPLYIDRHLSLPSLCEASHNDGWGEGFGQIDIPVGDFSLNIHFWSPECFFESITVNIGEPEMNMQLK